MGVNRTATVKTAAILAIVVGFAFLPSTKAEASVISWICNDAACTGGGDIIVADGSAGDTAAAAGVVGASGSVGGLSFVSNISQSKPALGQPSMDLSFVATGIGEAWLYASDTDFTAGSALLGTLNGNFSGSSTVQGTIYGGVDNTSLTFANPVSTGVLNTSPFNSGALIHPAATTSPYSLTLGVHVTRTTEGTTTGDFLVMPVPDGGATASLLGLALIGVGYLRRQIG